MKKSEEKPPPRWQTAAWIAQVANALVQILAVVAAHLPHLPWS